MTKLLEQAFKMASELSDVRQDKLARMLLEEMEPDRIWDELFSRPESEALLEQLADEALSEHRARPSSSSRHQNPVALRSVLTRSFHDAHGRLPEQELREARSSWEFPHNPTHPSLDLKRVSRRRPVYSVCVVRDNRFRALGAMDGEVIVWFWIGSHQEYDRLLRQL